MAVQREKLKSIPGTTIFDGAESRKGYRINKFSMSFIKPENREAFTANEEAYMEKWKLNKNTNVNYFCSCVLITSKLRHDLPM